MTIGFDGITPEQCKLGGEIIRHDVEYMEPGTGAWVEFEALWADADGALWIDMRYVQLDDDEVAEMAGTDPTSVNDVVYMFYVTEGFIVSHAHAVPSEEKTVIYSTTSPSKKRMKHSQPVCGFITDMMTLDMVNNEFLAEYEGRLPATVPSSI